MDGDRFDARENEATSEVRLATRGWLPGDFVDGCYRIDRRLGRGGTGIVFRAHDVLLDRTVAIKALDVAQHGEDERVRFRREARALAQVRHDNVCQIYAYGEHGHVSYFAMEHVAGRDLDTMIQAHAALGQRVPLHDALAIVRQVGRGLTAVHERGVVHRDVKPSNVIVEDETMRAVLIDFGLAQRPLETGARTSFAGGTPSYIAPEQAMDPTGLSTGPRADIYAFACSIFELLSGRPPFEGPNAFAILVRHLQDPPPAISSLRPELARLDGVLLRAMSKSPEGRQASCEELIADIDHGIHVADGRRLT